jgi:hypothetical protein
MPGPYRRLATAALPAELLGPPNNEAAAQCFNAKIRTWARTHAPPQPMYTFDA